MKVKKKTILISVSIWVALKIIYSIAGIFHNCDSIVNLSGTMCTNKIQDILLVFFYILALPFVFIGASPNLSTFGPIGPLLFWIGGLIDTILLALLINWIIRKIKKR